MPPSRRNKTRKAQVQQEEQDAAVEDTPVVEEEADQAMDDVTETTTPETEIEGKTKITMEERQAKMAQLRKKLVGFPHISKCKCNNPFTRPHRVEPTGRH